jgi:hypothetical protein
MRCVRGKTGVRPVWAVSALLLALLVGLATPRPAAAGEFTITACQADSGGFASGAFEDFATRGMRWRRACNPYGRGLRGLVTSNVVRRGRVAHGARSAFVLNAPPGTSFSQLRWSGHAHRRDCRYALQLYALRPDRSAVAIKNVRANRHCPRRDTAQASGWPRPRSYGLGNATRIVQRVVCVGSGPRRYCSARGLNYIRTFTAEATVVDTLGPSVSVLADSPLAGGGWVAGMQRFSYEAADNVGIKSGRAWLAGTSRGIDSRPCSYSQRVPCPSGRSEIEVDTRRVPEGSQALHVSAEDAAGNTADSPPVTARIDNTAPGAVSVGIDGGEVWRNRNDFDLGWANPPEPDRAPIEVAHYRICDSDGKNCSEASRGGAGIDRLTDVSVPSAGEWELRLWREDAAGNRQSANASLPVRLRYDPEPPEVGFEQLSAEDPTRVSALVTDRVPGLAGGSIEISRVGSNVWQVLPGAKDDTHLTARIDDAALPAGEYALRATAFDQASNQASSDRNFDGQPMRVTLPLRLATSMRAGVVRQRKVRRTVRRGGKPHKVRRTVKALEPRAKVGFGRKVRLGGRLVDAAGMPLVGAQVNVYATPREGAERLAGTATTNDSGRYAVDIEARSSQALRFVYPGTATILPVQDTATLLVKGRSSLKVDRGRVLNGQKVAFSGRVRGRPLPSAGKLIEMQVRLSDDWQTFRTTRSGPKGGWRVSYRFERTCGLQSFRFRARLPGEAGYPLEAGGSRGLTVRVKGPPCFTG